MSRRRLLFSLLVPACLIGLVAVLATLQYRWLGQVSEAEREQLRQSLTGRAREFADGLDVELSALFKALDSMHETPQAAAWSALADSLDRWRSHARFPELVRNLYLAEPAGDASAVRRWNPEARAFDAAPLPSWPASLEPVRVRIGAALRPPVASSESRAQIVTIALTPVVPEVPALVVAVPAPGSLEPYAPPPILPGGPAPATMVWARTPGTYLVAELDEAYIRGTVLPALAARYFPEPGTAAFRVAVLGKEGALLFSAGVPEGALLDAAHADVVVPMLSVRLSARDVLVGTHATMTRVQGPAASGANTDPAAPGTGRDAAENGTVGRFSIVIERGPGAAGGPTPGSASSLVRVARSSPAWTVVVQHAAGSLDAAVSAARTRNLWLSFGILAVLSAGVVLVVINGRRSEQLAARQMDFVATVSHELRTPLAVIRSAAQNLAAGVITDLPQARRYGELIDGEGRRLGDMVEQVLDYAGLEGNRHVRAPQPVDIPSLVEGVATQCRPVCDAARCEFEIDSGAQRGIPIVMGDEAALGRAVSNLIHNAAKHGADGGWIGLSVASVQGKAGPEVQIVVRDRGRGIEPAELSHIFDPFRRGRHAIEQQIRGNGLGLNLVKRIVEAHGGRVTATSTPGEGAAFVLQLPAGAPPPPGVHVSGV